MAILISNKVEFKTKTVTREKEGHFIIINESIPQNGITILNIYAPHSRSPKYMKKKLVESRKKQTIQKQQFDRSRVTDVENKLMVTRGWGEG